MKQKNVKKKVVFEGLGFPVILTNVPVKKIMGEQVLDINYNKLQKNVLLTLIHHPHSLTGAEIHFIRTYFELSKTDFAKLLGVSHAAIIKWEKANQKSAHIQESTEICIRMFVLHQLGVKDHQFRKFFNILMLKLNAHLKNEPLILNSEDDLLDAI